MRINLILAAKPSDLPEIYPNFEAAPVEIFVSESSGLRVFRNIEPLMMD